MSGIAIGPQETADAGPGGSRCAPSAAVVVAALSGIAAAWIGAGSVGLLSHPLRHALTWVAMAVALIAAWGCAKRTRNEVMILLAAAMLGVAMTVPAEIVVNILAVTLVLAVLAHTLGGVDRRLLQIAASATAVLAVYRLALTTIPTVWLAADLVGGRLGRLAGAIGGEPLWVGASFAGLDFLVLMAALYAGWLVHTSGAKWTRAFYAAAAIAVGHLAYLLLLSHTSDLVAWLPAVSSVPEADLYIPPDWQAGEALRTLLPWNVPAVAAVIHLATAAFMFCWAPWKPVADAAGAGTHVGHVSNVPGTMESCPTYFRATWKLLVLAGLIPVLTTLFSRTSDLGGVKIVAYQQGYLDWDKPQHGEYGRASAGMYGMLGELVSSLGGQFVLSQDLAEADLDGADVLLLIHPDRPWAAGQLERVWQFVRRGGSLLVAAEPRVRNDDRRSSFDDVLEPTAMRVRFDTAISQIGQWEQAYQSIAHPATTGIGDRRNRFGIMMGSSIDVGWPARPLLVGRWGWSDPGSDSVETRSYRLDAGERLGDLVLAAEQRLGSGRVVVLGDTACLSNQTITKSYPFIGRLLAYLGGRSANPQAAWRQTLGIVACVGLVGLVLTGIEALPLAAVALVMALSLASSGWFGHRATRVMPDGRTASPKVAYIDATHLEAFSDEAWTPDGVAGLSLTLMRNGYLPLFAPDLAPERLDRADLLISIAPGRKFSAGERAAVRRFVDEGGIFIATVGAEHTRASEQLLDGFQFGVARSPVRPGKNLLEPEPMGCFRGPYLDVGNYQAKMIFHAGWPIRCPAETAEVLVRGFADLPIVGLRFFGKGKIVLIGDSGFAMNKNLEHVDGEPLQGRYDNADFWRWLLSYITGQPPWIPPEAEAETETDNETDNEADNETDGPADDGAAEARGEEART